MLISIIIIRQQNKEQNINNEKEIDCPIRITEFKIDKNIVKKGDEITLTAQAVSNNKVKYKFTIFDEKNNSFCLKDYSYENVIKECIQLSGKITFTVYVCDDKNTSEIVEKSIVVNVDDTNNEDKKIKEEKEVSTQINTDIMTEEKTKNNIEVTESNKVIESNEISSNNNNTSNNMETDNKNDTYTEIIDNTNNSNNNNSIKETNNTEKVQNNNQNNNQNNSSTNNSSTNNNSKVKELPNNVQSRYTDSNFNNVLYTLVNNLRQQNGLPTLKISSQIESCCQYKSMSMVQYDYFSHEYPNYPGEKYSYVMKNVFGINASYTGECVAMNYGDLSAEGIFNLWLNSAPHKAIMLSNSVNTMGFSGVIVDNQSCIRATLQVAQM